MRRGAVSALLLGLVGLLAAMVFIWLHPADRDSSVLNRGWNGLSDVSAELGASAILSYDVLDGLAGPATLIAMPRLQPDDASLSVLERFVRAGGTLVLLDDFGYGNHVLSSLGIDITFHGALLVDPLYCHRNPSMPRVEFDRAPAGADAGSMTLNQATWLQVGRAPDVWARSSYFSYGDLNGDGRRGAGEPDGPFAIGAVADLGAGRVVVVSDASLLLNSMVRSGDNVEAVARFIRGEVLIDQLHLPEVQTDRSKGGLYAVRTAVGSGAGLVLLVLLAFTVAVMYAWYNRGRQDND